LNENAVSRRRVAIACRLYTKWFVEHLFVIFPAQAIVGRVIQTFQEFPPR
jgi:hypothetical protein